MTKRSHRIEELFDAGRFLRPPERARFLARECGDDADLLQELTSLLEAHDRAEGFLAETATDLTEDDRADRRRADSDRIIGSYQLLRPLGEGESSEVFLAVRADAEYRKMVAIKLLRRGMDSRRVLERFHQERQILAALDHPNIAHLLDGGQTEDGRPYFVMEYVEGERIDSYCDRVGLSINERIDLFTIVCDAVHHAHRTLVVHRDLKPDNILITTGGEPKLLDFGIAKLMDPELAIARTATVARVMTPRYASPEQARGDAITTATDVYSLGVLLYELLTHRPPYDLRERSISEIQTVICEQQPEPPSTVVEGGDARRLKGDLDTIVMTALRKEPERRYGSVQELAEDLRRHRRRLPVSARPDTLGYRAGKFLKRNAIAVTAVALVAAALVTGAAVSLWQARLARAAQTRAERVSGFMVDLFQVSDPSEVRGNSVTAREILDRGVTEISGGLGDQPEAKDELLKTMSVVYMNLGLYDQALELAEQRVEIGRRIFGADHEELGPAINDLGAVLKKMERFEEAEQHFRHALPALRKLHGPNHNLVASALNNLASALTGLGRYSEAEPFARQALAMRRALPGDNDELIAIDISNLGFLLAEQGRYEESVVLRREALEMIRSSYGEDHPKFALALGNLALELYQLGEVAEAEQHQREALSLLRRVLGDDHPSTALIAQNLAVLMLDRGEHQEGEQLLRQVLEVQRSTFGEKHSVTAGTMYNIASTQIWQGKFDEAERLHEEVLAIRRELLGEEHPLTAQSLVILARLAHRRGDLEKAERRYRRSLNVLRALLPPGHLNLVRPLVGLGSVLTERGRPEPAEPLLREAVEICRTRTTERTTEVALAEGALGENLTALGRYEEAEPLLVASRDGYVAGAAPGHIQRLAVERLIDLYQRWGRSEEAARYLAALNASEGDT